MNALQRFENFMERMLEGSFTRLFRSEVQPAEVARRIERAMENGVQVSVGRQYAPNQFQVRLNPDDYKAFEPYRARLEREMGAFVRETAAERGWELMAAPQVMLHSNGETPRHGIEVEARLVESTARISESDMEAVPYQPTVAMPIQQPKRPATPRRAPAVQPSATLRTLAGRGAGSTVQITTALFGLGRELDNDLVIEDSRVSRHHAQIVYQHDRYMVRDLRSTNGTFVNGQPVGESVLTSGDRVSLGGFELQFNA
jgi:predicted component of type VI protein secretion system